MTKLSLILANSIVAPEQIQEQILDHGETWIVTVFDNSRNTYEEVMTVLVLATGCTQEEAYIEAWEIDHFGSCVVHRSSEGECQSVADVVSAIGIKVEVTREP